MQELTTQWHCAMHYMLNPVIEINGDNATANFNGLFAFMANEGEAPVWLSNIYEDTFTRTAAGWRFQSIRIGQTFADPVFLAGYADQMTES